MRGWHSRDLLQSAFAIKAKADRLAALKAGADLRRSRPGGNYPRHGPMSDPYETRARGQGGAAIERATTGLERRDDVQSASTALPPASSPASPCPASAPTP